MNLTQTRITKRLLQDGDSLSAVASRLKVTRWEVYKVALAANIVPAGKPGRPKLVKK